VVVKPKANSFLWVLLGFGILMLMMFSAFLSNPSCRSAHAYAGIPSDFCLVTDAELTYSGGGTVTNVPVRFTWNTQSLVLQEGISNETWDLRSVIGSFSNEIFINLYDPNSLNTVVWATLESISSGQTQTVSMYSGTNDLYRDQGVLFTGGEKIVANDHNILDTTGTGNLQIDLWMDINDDSVRDQVILDKKDASNGYEIRFADVASVLNLQFLINTSSCGVVWNSGWLNEHNKFTFVYANSTAATDAFIYVNDVLVSSCDLDAGTVGVTTYDLVIGEDSFSGADSLSGLAIKTVTVFDNGTRILKYTFDAIDMTETVAVNPFQGVIADHSGNGFNASYEYDRDQSSYAVVLRPSQLVDTTTATQVSVGVTPINVLGDVVPFDVGFSDKTTGTFFYTWFVEPLEGIGTSTWHGITLAMTGLGIVIGIAIFMSTDRQFTPLGVFVSGMPLSLSGASGWTPWWYIFMWWALTVFTWWGSIRMKQSN
jgi:hypothetical protein